jgi:hypothetical protein
MYEIIEMTPQLAPPYSALQLALVPKLVLHKKMRDDAIAGDVSYQVTRLVSPFFFFFGFLLSIVSLILVWVGKKGEIIPAQERRGPHDQPEAQRYPLGKWQDRQTGTTNCAMNRHTLPSTPPSGDGQIPNRVFRPNFS